MRHVQQQVPADFAIACASSIEGLLVTLTVCETGSSCRPPVEGSCGVSHAPYEGG